MNKTFKPIPDFTSEAEEREFWQTHDSTEYVDWSKAKRGIRFPNLKLTTKPITLRLPVSMIDRLKIEAHRMDIPYQSLIKQLIYKGLGLSS
ncbi:BrnA antitoxin family protein [Candidatus Gottesmanbacteria bacterium]|nr:BrnA antitoxin family protein [Candidatus Gottesmanbacteria bacterium]